MIDNATYLMVSIFQRLFRSDDDSRDIEEYVKDNKLEIKNAGRAFEYLDLADLDQSSLLGWKPTRTLLKIIAQRASKYSVTRFSYHEYQDVLLDVLHREVFGKNAKTSRVNTLPPTN